MAPRFFGYFFIDGKSNNPLKTEEPKNRRTEEFKTKEVVTTMRLHFKKEKGRSGPHRIADPGTFDYG